MNADLSRRVVCVLLLLLPLAAGCSGDPAVRFRRHVQRGDAYYAEKKYREAVIEYRTAVSAAPNSPTARFKLAESYAALNDLPAALVEYTRVVDVDPAHTEANLKAGNLLLLSRQYEEAQARARLVLEKDPQHARALLMLANAMGGSGKFDEAVAANTRAAALDPKNVGIFLNLGALSYIQGDVKQAEAAYLDAVRAAPSSMDAQLGLAEFYLIAGRPADAERVGLAALTIDPAHVGTNRLLGNLYVSSGRMAAAEPFFQKAAEIANDLPTRFALADYYIAAGQRDRAVSLLRPLAKEPRGFVGALGRIALIQQTSGQTAEATATLDEILAAEPKAAGALALKAHIELGARNLSAAMKLAEAAVAADARSTRAHFALAMVQVATGRADDARKSLLDVLRLEPSAAEAAVELAKIHLARREMDSAIQYADQAVKTAPRFFDAHLVRLRTLIVRPREEDRAEAQLREMERLFPTSADVALVRGEFLARRGQTALARAAFERALQFDATRGDALQRLIAQDVNANRMAEARRRVDLAVERVPKSAQILMVAGKTYSASGDNAMAEKLLRQAMALEPSNLEVYLALASVYLLSGRQVDAQREFMELARLEPGKPSAPTMVALLHETQQNPAAAEEWYKKALQIDPRAATAANNLAWLYADRGQNLDDALLLAQTAYAALPKQPEVADTLGWVYYKQNLPSMAVPPLERAIQGNPTNPTYQFHLGLVHAKLGQDRKARVLLEAALRLNPNFPGALEAKRVLAKLVY